MSPILVRPVREQFEHDRVIRVLQAKYKRKYEVAINPGAEQHASVGVGDLTMYPDLVLFSQERTRKIHGTIEVETAESINTLEAMAEWAPFSRLRTPFYLYVPANSIDTVRRLCTEHSIDPAEIWTYHIAIDQVRFTMVHRSPDAPKGSIAEHKPKPVPAPMLDSPEPPVEQAKIAAPKPAAVRPVAAKAAATAVSGKKPTAVAKAPAPAPKPGKAAIPAKAAKSPKPATSVKSVKSAKGAKPAKAVASRAAKPVLKAKKAAKKAKSRR